MGFLSDFRSASVPTAAPKPDSPTTRRRAPAGAREPQEDIPYHVPTDQAPAASASPTADIPYYEPAHGSDAPMATPAWTPPESDDFPYYTPPTNGAAGLAPNWAPPSAGSSDWAPLPAGAEDWAPPSNDGTYWTLPLANGTSPYPGGAYHAPPKRRPPIWIIGAVAAAVAVIAGVGAMFVLKSSPSLNGLSADQVMAKMVAAAHKAGTFHVEVTDSQAGSVVHVSMDVGTSGGNFESSIGGHTATVRVVGGGVYLKADETALIGFGFTSTQAQQYAGQWLAVPTNNPDIQQMMQSTDANKIIDQFLHLSGPLTRLSSGQGGVTIQGTVPDNDFNQGSGAGDTANLGVSNKEPFVPLSISFSDPSNGSTQMSFSRWGRPVVLTVPPNAVSLLPGGGSS